MCIRQLLLTLAVAAALLQNASAAQLLPDRFPDAFRFGSASSAYQVEGGWQANGKGESIWDRLTHTRPELIVDRQNADVAADSYHRYKQDVQMLRNASMDFYRFSIAWSRIMPNGDLSGLNEPGLRYYDALIDELLANGVQPVVTMFHWDMPQPLQEWGGLANAAIIPYFVDYAQVLFARYGDRVRTWITFNEPMIICDNGYGQSDRAPLVHSPGIADYMCSRNILLAHARAYELYRQGFRRSQGGQVGITVNCPFVWPSTISRMLLPPIGHCSFTRDGGYPPVMVEQIARRSQAEGRTRSRLPELSATEQQLIQGSADFLGVNYYTSFYAEPAKRINTAPSMANDREVDTSVDHSWPVAKSKWLRSVPEGLYGVLDWFRREYDSPDLMITENGWSDDGELQDQGRIDYLRAHLNATLKAINDGCKVRAYTAWSLLDNFEWMQGFSERFGIFHVDFDEPERTRTPKDSVRFLREVIETRKIPD